MALNFIMLGAFYKAAILVCSTMTGLLQSLSLDDIVIVMTMSLYSAFKKPLLVLNKNDCIHK